MSYPISKYLRNRATQTCKIKTGVRAVFYLLLRKEKTSRQTLNTIDLYKW